MKLAWFVFASTGLVLGAGCSSTGPGDTGVPFVGLRSYVVTWKVAQTSGGDLGTSFSPHAFTMVVDADAGSAIVGDEQNAAVYPFTQSAGTLRFTGPVALSYDDGGGGWSVTYRTMTLARGGDDRLTGSAMGNVFTFSHYSDVSGPSAAVTTTLMGVPDAVAPTLTLEGRGAVDDPFSSLDIVASEPLPPDPRPILVSGDGSTMTLAPVPDDGSRFVRLFSVSATMLHYGQSYRITVDGITDFAGLPASASATFTTRAPPPLIPEDGFESALVTTLGGAKILTGSDAPTIAGARSLYIPPVGSAGPPSVSAPVTRLALRLAVTPGDTVIRFAYRQVNPYGSLTIYVGSEGGTKRYTLIGSTGGETTLATIPGEGERSLGPLATAEIPLPADVGSEVVIAEIKPGDYGGLPALPVSGLIIDDLRVE